MPVPVPRTLKEPAHPVIKINQSASDYNHSVFQHLTQSLPRPPQGPPPSLATREEWISSLPSWRRNKPRRVWEEDTSGQYCATQGFQQGLAVADNATVIKGALAQARIPPVSTLIASADSLSAPPYPYMYAPSDEEDADEEMDLGPAEVHGWQSDGDSQMSSVSAMAAFKGYPQRTSETESAFKHFAQYSSGHSSQYRAHQSTQLPSADVYERGAFTPVFEDMSPDPVAGGDPASSPLGPATPFAEFVDRAVAAAQSMATYDYSRSAEAAARLRCAYQGDYCGAQCYQCHAFQNVEQPMQVAPPAPEPVVTPTASASYKKLAEPLAEWIASYVWRVCTTGMDLSPDYAQPQAFPKHYSNTPPAHLASSTHSMLLSTLLQPSAIFLALWYIVRLPVFFGPVHLGPEHVKEMRFRAELLGEARLSFDRNAHESYAPFRLILLGCMLANKWLDDHTFSNKTWHTISNVPVRSLNKLESLALDLFTYDLSIQPRQWVEWLSHLNAYHSSLSMSSCPQPISRPSTSPHTIVRKAIETLLQVQAKATGCDSCGDRCMAGPPQPLFVAVEERKREELDIRCHQSEESFDALEIDLDEDGPLREEYLPRRRTSGSGAGPTRRDNRSGSGGMLPPPAKWSPSADEPIVPSRVHGPYVAPQPIAHPSTHLSLPPLPFVKGYDHRGLWPYLPTLNRAGYIGAPVYQHQPQYMGYDYPYPASHSHSRTQSLSYNQAIGEQPQSRFRSYSQTRYDQGYSDLRMSSGQYAPSSHASSRWTATIDPAYAAPYDRPFEFQQRALKV